MQPTAGTTRRHSALTVILGATLLAAACDDAGSDGPMTAPSGGGTPAAVTAQGQRDDLATLVAAFDAAWNAGDAGAYAALYAEDAQFINPLGVVLPNQGAIRAGHTFLFAGPFQGSTHESNVRRITFLTGTVAIVDLDVSVTGFVQLPPGLNATEPGVLRSRERLVLVKRAGEWQIVMNQITAVAPPP